MKNKVLKKLTVIMVLSANGSEENQAELRIISEKCPFPAAELAEETLEDAYLYQTQDINRIRSRRDENAVV